MFTKGKIILQKPSSLLSVSPPIQERPKLVKIATNKTFKDGKVKCLIRLKAHARAARVVYFMDAAILAESSGHLIFV